jgi:SPX domain protein involved in polyphosphate accumulation
MDDLISNKVESVVRLMDPISLEEMDNVRLMRRRDIKFVLPTRSVPELLMNVKEKYRILEIGGERIHHYQTLYYDTPEFDMYHEHHSRRLNRYKVRIRKYLTSDISFLEVKFKNNKGETIKKRIRPENPGNMDGLKSEAFVKENSPYKVSDIQPSLHNGFKRLTLVSKSNPERVTIDLELNYRPVSSNKDLHLPGLSVIEIKRNRDAEPSDMISQLRSARFHATGFSKYLMGTAMLEPKVKTNLVKSKIRQINKYKNIS